EENIAATDQVEPRKWRIRRDVLPGEGAEFADGVLDLIHAVALEKKSASSAFLRHLCQSRWNKSLHVHVRWSSHSDRCRKSGWPSWKRAGRAFRERKWRANKLLRRSRIPAPKRAVEHGDLCLCS